MRISYFASIFKCILDYLFIQPTTLLTVSQTFYALTLRHVSTIHRRSTKCPNRNICKCRRGWTKRWLQDTHASILCLSFFRRDRYPPQQEFQVTYIFLINWTWQINYRKPTFTTWGFFIYQLQSHQHQLLMCNSKTCSNGKVVLTMFYPHPYIKSPYFAYSYTLN